MTIKILAALGGAAICGIPVMQIMDNVTGIVILSLTTAAVAVAMGATLIIKYDIFD